jgi:hypothetical protein
MVALNEIGPFEAKPKNQGYGFAIRGPDASLRSA